MVGILADVLSRFVPEQRNSLHLSQECANYLTNPGYASA
jgi:hypothetical protein